MHCTDLVVIPTTSSHAPLLIPPWKNRQNAFLKPNSFRVTRSQNFLEHKQVYETFFNHKPPLTILNPWAGRCSHLFTIKTLQLKSHIKFNSAFKDAPIQVLGPRCGFSLPHQPKSSNIVNTGYASDKALNVVGSGFHHLEGSESERLNSCVSRLGHPSTLSSASAVAR